MFDRNSAGGWSSGRPKPGLDFDRWSWSASWVDAWTWMEGKRWWPPIHSMCPATVRMRSSMRTALFRVVSDGDSDEVLFSPKTILVAGPRCALVLHWWGDLDQDGDPDMVGLGTGQFCWWEQRQRGNNLTPLDCPSPCAGHMSNSEAIGTAWCCTWRRHAQQEPLRAGEDLFAQHSTTQFFGLGTSLMADSLEIFWPKWGPGVAR